MLLLLAIYYEEISSNDLGPVEVIALGQFISSKAFHLFMKIATVECGSTCKKKNRFEGTVAYDWKTIILWYYDMTTLQKVAEHREKVKGGIASWVI